MPVIENLLSPLVRPQPRARLFVRRWAVNWDVSPDTSPSYYLLLTVFTVELFHLVAYDIFVYSVGERHADASGEYYRQ